MEEIEQLYAIEAIEKIKGGTYVPDRPNSVVVDELINIFRYLLHTNQIFNQGVCKNDLGTIE